MPIQLRRKFSGIAVMTAAALVLCGSNLSPAAAQELPEDLTPPAAITQTQLNAGSDSIIPSGNGVPFDSVSDDQGIHLGAEAAEFLGDSAADVGLRSLSDEQDPDLNIEVSETGGAVNVEVESEGVESTVEVSYNEDAPLDELVEAVTIDAVVDGEIVRAELIVQEFTYLGDDNFAVTVQDRGTGEIIHISSAEVSAQAFPVLWVLGLLARVGIKALIKHIGKTQIKKAAKSYLLNGKGVNWTKILAPKHRWSSVGAKSKEQVADLMARAMAEGNHVVDGGAVNVMWKYKGETIVVTYGKSSGKIGNGWVKKR